MDHSKLKTLPPLERLIYWIRVRENVRLLKEEGRPPPWTKDPIVGTYRFCNVRRMDDRVSRWLLDNWYTPFKDHPNMVPAVGLARLFNDPDTLLPITTLVFNSQGDPWWDRLTKLIKDRRAGGHRTFNPAYVVSTSGRSMDKVDAVVGYAKGLEGLVPDTASMERTHGLVMRVYGFSSFMAGQVVADLRWALSGKWVDKNDWAPVGPGSARGLARLLYASDEWEAVSRNYLSKSVTKDGKGSWLWDFREHVLEGARKKLPGLIADRLEAHDYQNCLCEYDKFERVLWGDGVPKQKYKETP